MFISSENCNNLLDLIATNEVYVLNKSETVTFYPTDFKFLLTEYDGEWCSSGNCSMTNALLYKNNRLTQLSDTDLGISDMDLTMAIYNSMVINTQLNNIISVFPNKFIVKSHTEKSEFSIYSIVFGIEILLPKKPACNLTSMYRARIEKIKGVACNTRSCLASDSTAIAAISFQDQAPLMTIMSMRLNQNVNLKTKFIFIMTSLLISGQPKHIITIKTSKFVIDIYFNV